MRYLPHTPADREAMLQAIGVGAIDDLFRDVPDGLLMEGSIDGLPGHQPEMAVERHLGRLAAKNVPAGSVPFFLGAGAYRHHVPAAVDHLIQRGEFLTAYTPYQPEVSQGTLQALFEFQTQVAMITGMEVANASMYDGATACAEAVMMAFRVTRRSRAVFSGGVHPHYRDVTRNLVSFTGGTLEEHDPDPRGAENLTGAIDGETACVVVQNPTLFGQISDLSPLAEAAHAAGALLIIVVTEAVSLGLMPSPGSMGADIVVAEGQSIGNPLTFGGPYVGLFATRQKYVRQMPGRLCGQTVDADGRRGFVLTLSTREQHIRREKATSNICTNSGLCALAFTIHMALLGETGFTRLARLNHARAVLLAERLGAIDGIQVLNEGFFNEFTIELPGDAAAIVDRLAARGILAGVPAGRLYRSRDTLDDLLLVTATEITTDADIDAFASALAEEIGQ